MRKYLLVLSLLAIVSGCSSPAAYKEVFNGAPTYNQKDFTVSKDALYPAVTKAVCSQNFTIESEDETKGSLAAKRLFQKGQKNITIALQIKITSNGNKGSTLFLNATQTTERVYIADRTRFFLWIIPLPGGGGKEATRTKEEEKVIDDKEFYNNFFAAVEKSIVPETPPASNVPKTQGNSTNQEIESSANH